ncbi:hypothetical protein HDU76_010569, partial [Blyttiomyces sp. JEL0837]
MLLSDPLNLGSSSNTSSIKYSFESIELCNSLGISSQGVSSPSSCITAYSNLQSIDSTTYSLNAATSDTLPNHWTEITSTTSLQSLTSSKSLTGLSTSSYMYVVVTWKRPVKITATTDVISPSTNTTVRLYTKGTSTIPNSDFVRGIDGGLHSMTNSLMTTTSVDSAGNVVLSEEAVVPVGSTSGWYPFLAPWVLSSADIFFRRSKIVTLVVDPASLLIRGALKMVDGVGMGNLVDGTGANVYVPCLELAPIAHNPVGDTIQIERYTLSITSQNVILELSIYSLYSATQLQPPSSVTVSVIPTTNGTILLTPRINSIVPVLNTWKFVDSLGNMVIEGLIRQSAVGMGGFVGINCGVIVGWVGQCSNTQQGEGL